MRIGTWNVEYAHPRRLKEIHATLEQNPADIWVITETHDDLRPSNCPYFAHSLPRPQNWSGIRAGSRWVSIWSRFPILQVVQLEVGDLERTVIAIIDTGATNPLLVYGTVLPWKGDRGVFNWAEHHRVIDIQAREWKLLRDRYPDADLCIAGDYNTDMKTGGHYGTKAGIAALRRALDTCDLYCVSDNSNVLRATLPYPPIDHIALPKRWRELATIVAAWPPDPKRLSDHSGYVVEISRATTDIGPPP